MGGTEVGTPVAATDGDDAELGDDDSSADGGSDLLRGLDAETDVALGVANDDDGLEPGALTGTGLLLDGLDLFRGIPRSVIRSKNCPVPTARIRLANQTSGGVLGVNGFRENIPWEKAVPS